MKSNMLDILIQYTDLPEDLIRSELKNLLKKSGISYEQVTLDQIRDILAQEMQDVILEAKHHNTF